MKANLSPSALIDEWPKNYKKNPPDIECNFYESAKDVPDPRDLSSENKNLVIFLTICFRETE